MLQALQDINEIYGYEQPPKAGISEIRLHNGINTYGCQTIVVGDARMLTKIATGKMANSIQMLIA